MTEELSMIEQAEKAALRMEEANKENAKNILKLEALEARRTLGGQSEAGHIKPELSKEDKDKMDMKNYFKGGALEGVMQ